MKFRKPLFWDYTKPNLISNILLPLTVFVKLNNILVNNIKKKKNKNIKTICIGNIYLGGTGKTPTTITLNKILKKLSKNISIGKKFYAKHNDEHMLLRKQVNLILDDNRQKIIDLAIKKRREILIFDDGLQDKNIEYDLKFVCFSADNWVGNGRLIPAGPLREKIQSLRKYDGVFFNNSNKENKKAIILIKKINPKIKIFTTKYKILNLNKFNKKKNYLIFSGIGNPSGFRNILYKNNIKVIKEIIFPDHYQYNTEDIKDIKKIAKKLNTKIITTEKDYVKISISDKKNIDFLKIDLIIENKNKLLNLIKSKLYE